MSYKIAFVGLVALCFGVTLCSTSGSAYSNVLRQAETKEYRVSLVQMSTAQLPYHSPVFTLRIVSKGTKASRSVQLHNPMTDITEMRIVGNSLLILGRVGNAAEIVTSLQLSGEDRRISFLCYAPRFSPSGRFLVYKKFYPRFADPAATSDVLVVFDTEAENRELLESGSKYVAEGTPLGEIIYPEENARTQRLESWIENVSDRHSIVSSAGYLWATGTTLVFVDVVGQQHLLVSVDFRDTKRLDIRNTLFDAPHGMPVTGLAMVKNGIKVEFQGGEDIVIDMVKLVGLKPEADSTAKESHFYPFQQRIAP